MADVAEATATSAEIVTESPPVAPQPIEFGGTPRNLVPAMALFFAGVLAFFMGMTDVFFAEAIAWVFMIWGVLLIFVGLTDIYETYTVTDDALVIHNAMHPWRSVKEWDWEHISRLDVLVGKKDWKPSDHKMQVYFAAADELAVDREDRAYDPELAGLIIERAGLKPASAGNPTALDALPRHTEATYTWQ
jgi:hypothetical protein